MTLPTRHDADRQKRFIRELAKGTPFAEAAEAAGYQDTAAVHSLLNSPAVARAVERGVRDRLAGVYGPRAMRILFDLAEDTKVHPAIRRAAAKDLITTAGYVAPKAADNAVNDKSISSMSAEELAALVNRMEGELAARAKDVSAPVAQGDDDELADMLG